VRKFASFFFTAGAAAIPIGIAVGRQRLQETTTSQTIPQIQPKDLNRFGLGLADLGKLRAKRQLGKKSSRVLFRVDLEQWGCGVINDVL
jgi:hypothetical protein